MAIATTYGLEKVTSPKNPIYQQLFTFYEYTDQVLSRTNDTMQTKIHSINNFIKFSGLTNLKDITNQQIYDWVKWHKERGNSARSINNYLYQLKAMLKWQKDENIEMPNLKLSRIAFQKEVRFGITRLRIRAFFGNLFYVLPRITLKPAN